ncbi:MAG TPA: ribose-phosphate pyrophosphokinase, partial [Gaiellaceae bacterium]|nr:ribose-phosphate pyrophosphokinase [Gaiellaceae bacterium]
MQPDTATELVLPGLETEPPMSQVRPGHWLERGPQKRLMVFAGRSHPELARRIAEQLGVELGAIELDTFPNGETYCRYDESIRGADLFLVQTGSWPVDQNVMELLLMIQAAKLASAKRITVVIPWFPYARQDRKAKPREPISARLIADMIQQAGADRVLTMDLHAGQIQGFFTIPVDHMTSLPLFARHFRDLGLTGERVVSVAPDAGRAKHAVRFAEMVGADFAIMHKTRSGPEKVEVTEVTGKVRGKIAIIGDDVTTTGGTLIAGAKAVMEHGAESVYVFVTHALLSPKGLKKLSEADLAGIVTTDTVPIDPIARP